MSTLLGSSKFNGTNGSKFQLNLYYDLLSQNIAGNYSIIRYYLYFQSLGYSGSGATVRGYINGTQVGTTTKISKNENKLMGTLDITVNHESSGQFPTINFSALIDTPWTLGDASLSGTLSNANIPSIPRVSSVSCPEATIDRDVTVSINRASNSFTHNLRWHFGSLSGTIADGVSTSYTWHVPNNCYSQIPNQTRGEGYIACDTYYGGTYIGRSTCSLYLRASETDSSPSIDFTITDINEEAVNATGGGNKIIKYISKPKMVITTQAKNYASIIAVTGEIGDGRAVNANEITFDNPQSGVFWAACRDSRQYRVQTPNKELQLIPYVILTANPHVYRPEPTTGKVIFELSGDYYSGSFGAVNNHLTIMYRYKESGGEYPTGYTTLTATIGTDNKYSVFANLGNNFDYQKSYDFDILVNDRFTSLQKIASITEGVPMLGLFKNYIETFGTKLISMENEKVKLNVDLNYPVGSIYLTMNSTNPSELFGGTWELISKGRVLVGVDENDTDFNEPGKTGGSKLQALRALIGAFDSSVNSIGYNAATKVPGNYNYTYGISGEYKSNISNDRINHSTDILRSDGGRPSCVQPYLTCYIWERTA